MDVDTEMPKQGRQRTDSDIARGISDELEEWSRKFDPKRTGAVKKNAATAASTSRGREEEFTQDP